MEDMILRFPFVGRNVLNWLDNQNLEKCKEASKFLKKFLENDRLLWIRKLQKYNQNHIEFKGEWKSTVKSISLENVKQMFIASEEFYKFHKERLEFQHTPLHIIAHQGNLQLFEYITRKIKNGLVNPKRSDGITPHGHIK